MPLDTEVGPSAQDTLCYTGTQLPPRGHSSQFSAHVYCGQTAAWIKMPLATEVGHIRIQSVSVLLTASQKISPDIFDCIFNTGCQSLIPPAVFGTDVDVAYFHTRSFGLLNARSARQKVACVHRQSPTTDVLALTETWIPSDAPNAVKLDVAPPGYIVLHRHHSPSTGRRGGGVAIVHLISSHLLFFKKQLSNATVYKLIHIYTYTYNKMLRSQIIYNSVNI